MRIYLGRVSTYPHFLLYTVSKRDLASDIHLCGLSCIHFERCVCTFLKTAVVHGTRVTKYLTIYRKIILSLSQDRLTIMTYNVLRFLVGIS